MRVAWFHCFNGVAGDMALGALLDAGAELELVRASVAELGVSGWSLQMQRTQRSGIAGTQALVHTDDIGHHRRFAEIRALLGSSPAHRRALEVFRVLAAVEGEIHGVPAEEVEFHEVGSLDALVDIVGVCAALESLGIDEVRCSPITVGTGSFRAAHGLLPNPGPAVVGLLARRAAPVVGAEIDVELTTPTGAALMTVLAAAFGPMPAMRIEGVGYGAGTRDLPGRPNLVQVVWGEVTPATGPASPGQPVQLLETNVDDATGEVLAHTIVALLAAGAHDAWVTPIVMKKGRPAHTVHALCDPTRLAAVGEVLVRETGSLGVRGTVLHRWPQRRADDVVELDGHVIRVKRGDDRVKVEHDDVARAAEALGLPVREVQRRAEAGALNHHEPAGRPPDHRPEHEEWPTDVEP